MSIKNVLYRCCHGHCVSSEQQKALTKTESLLGMCRQTPKFNPQDHNKIGGAGSLNAIAPWCLLEPREWDFWSRLANLEMPPSDFVLHFLLKQVPKTHIPGGTLPTPKRKEHPYLWRHKDMKDSAKTSPSNFPSVMSLSSVAPSSIHTFPWLVMSSSKPSLILITIQNCPFL